MCIAIVKTRKGHITEEQLRNCFKNNKDGAGIAYTLNGKIHIIKGIFNIDEFVRAVRHVENIADGAVLIHCRISTSGLVDKKNCHPHQVHSNCVMIHNGVLDIDVPKDSTVSDTVLFVRNYLKPLPKNFMFKKYFLNLLEYAIGDYNKFCFLHSNGAYAIVNEEAGEWVDGVWYSNDSYEDSWYKRYQQKQLSKYNNYNSYYSGYQPSYYGWSYKY